MADSATLEVASKDDVIDGTDLQASVDSLRQMANGLMPYDTSALSVDELQAIAQRQAELRSAASKLVNAQIALLAGEAKVTADHINGAIGFARGVVAQIADIKDKLAKAGAIVDFIGAVITGNGKVILQAAHTLKGQLGR
jgi:hypothetical protein